MTRPLIQDFKTPQHFVRAMLEYRKKQDRSFSVASAARGLRRLSPTLVTLVSKGQRAVTLDRVDEFAKLLDLNAAEKNYFRKWLGQLEDYDFVEGRNTATSTPDSRKEVGLSLLSDWINVYVKDFFQISGVQSAPERIEKQLLSVASPKRIQRAIRFLLAHGYLRKTPEKKIVVETNLATAQPAIPSHKIRKFHKGALQLAKLALDLYPPSERFANTLTIPLDEASYAELKNLIDDFAEKLKDFAARHPAEGNRLYQLIVNLSPIGGKIE